MKVISMTMNRREVLHDTDCADCLCRVCAKNSVNDAHNPAAPYKDCGCDNCSIGSQLVETTADCRGFVPDCDDCEERECDGDVCRRTE